MTVSRGREFLSIPGPTNIPDAVLAAMHRPAIDIYAGDMLAVTHSLLEDLPKVFRTTGRTYIYAANGHGGWEAALTNVLSRGETVLVLESGLFALGWGDMARMMGVKVEVLKGDPRRAVDPVALGQRLAADTAQEIKAILVVQIDTASGVVNDLAAIHRAIASVRHPAHEHADLRTRYWDWTFRNGEAHYQKYGGTPPEHLLFGLRKALDMLFEE